MVKEFMINHYDLPMLAVLMGSMIASSIAKEPKLLNYLLEDQKIVNEIKLSDLKTEKISKD